MSEHGSNLYGYLAQFDTAEQVLNAAKLAHAQGYRKMDAYTPFPVHGLPEAVGEHKTYVPLLVLTGGLFGAFLGFFMQWYANTVDFPWNIGGRPHNSWVAFIPITFELTVLFAGLTALILVFALNGLPEPYHPLFNIPEFDLATRTQFFLCIQADDRMFDAHNTRVFLESVKPTAMWEVPKVVYRAV